MMRTLGSQEAVNSLARKPMEKLVSSILKKLTEISLEARALEAQSEQRSLKTIDLLKRERRARDEAKSFHLELERVNQSLEEENGRNEKLLNKLDSACSERDELLEKIRRLELEISSKEEALAEELNAKKDALAKQEEELRVAFAKEKLAYRDKLMAMAKGMMEDQYSKGCLNHGERICYYFPEAEERHKQLYEARFEPFTPEEEEEDEEECQEANPVGKDTADPEGTSVDPTTTDAPFPPDTTE